MANIQVILIHVVKTAWLELSCFSGSFDKAERHLNANDESTQTQKLGHTFYKVMSITSFFHKLNVFLKEGEPRGKMKNTSLNVSHFSWNAKSRTNRLPVLVVT